ncbi:DUF3575 domain-containing protein [Porphyromonas levii]|uniref:DUF3575 domain-containing protein n=1 Tax=Porphyromonas levii TaxID=28114 RepID=UPI001B8CA014|nr:hypothetical protein [Porphyromonas levii]
MKRFFLCVVAVGLSMFCHLESKAQFYSVSVNTLALPTATLNGDVSMTLNRNLSAHADVSINPWRIEKFRIQHFMVRPQIRYWLSESYRGWFFGAHGVFAGYHLGIPRYMRYKVKGIAVGGGVDVGYQLPLSPRWNLEFALGGSVLWTDYFRSECKNCGKILDEKSGVYVLPTKAALSVVYLF